MRISESLNRRTQMVFLQHMRATTAKLLHGHRAAQVVGRSFSTEATDAAAAALRMVRNSIFQHLWPDPPS